MKAYLYVPFTENGEARSLGAKFDKSVKRWYAPNNEKKLLDKYPNLT